MISKYYVQILSQTQHGHYTEERLCYGKTMVTELYCQYLCQDWESQPNTRDTLLGYGYQVSKQAILNGQRLDDFKIITFM